MQENSAPEEMKHRHYYYPLPGSDSSAAKADLNNEQKEGTWAQEAAEGSSYEGNISENGVSYKSKAHLNKYALAGAILASTNSILLGYGELF